MPYKQNRLRMKRYAISKKRSEQGKYGNEVKRKRMRERAIPLEVVGTIRTTGNMGDHFIEILDGGDESHVWLRVDGELRKPRTMNGVHRILSKWIWREQHV